MDLWICAESPRRLRERSEQTRSAGAGLVLPVMIQNHRLSAALTELDRPPLGTLAGRVRTPPRRSRRRALFLTAAASVLRRPTAPATRHPQRPRPQA